MENLNIHALHLNQQLLQEMADEIGKYDPKNVAVNFFKNKISKLNFEPSANFDTLSTAVLNDLVDIPELNQEARYLGVDDDQQEEFIEVIIRKIKTFLIKLCKGEIKLTKYFEAGIIHSLTHSISQQYGIDNLVVIIYLATLIKASIEVGVDSFCDAITSLF